MESGEARENVLAEEVEACERMKGLPLTLPDSLTSCVG
jgi:hypothetical protein